MKIKKTLSDKVIAANRRNARESTGPTNVAAIKYNALKHGLLAKHIVFRSEEEETEFHHLVDQLDKDLTPTGALQHMLLDEIAITFWKLQIALGWELDDIRNRRMASRELLRKFISHCDDDRVSVLSDKADGAKGPECVEQLGWDCREVVLKTGGAKDNLLAYDLDTGRNSAMELRLTSSMETILRYQGSLKRDLYRAIQTLLSLKDGNVGAARLTAPKKSLGTRDEARLNFTKQSH